MDTGNKTTKPRNPAENTNPISLLFFFYMFPIFKKTYKYKLTEEELFSPLKEHTSSRLGSKLEKAWKEEYRIHKKTALHRALFRIFGLRYTILGLIRLFDELLLIVVMPYCIRMLVSYLEAGQTRITKDEALIYAAALVITLLLDAVMQQPNYMGLQHIAMKIRVACSSLIYRKTLRFSREALGNTTVGQLVNLLSNDVSKFDQLFGLTHYAWIGPIQVALGTWLLYREIGVSAFFGMGFLVSFVPLQIWLAKKMSVMRLKTALRTDERVKLMNEIISGIQVIKMYCWEKPFAHVIDLARRSEMRAIRSHSCLLGILYSFEVFVSRTAIFVSIVGYVLLGNYVSADKVFAITAIYNQMRTIITIIFSLSITALAEMHVTIDRIHKLMVFDEREQDCEEDYDKMNGNYPSKLDGLDGIKNGINGNGTAIELHKKIKEPKLLLSGVSAKWSQQSTENTLSDITFNVPPNKMLAIIGPVGSGKSSIVNLILKELPVKSGKLEIDGKISYASQEPWLFAASVRQNILFGEEYDEERYKMVVEVCALKSDFALLPHGDKTLVGEKGKALSGGQKARVNLARCVYKKADIYLLDDPLSAVDANVGKHLYDRCIKQFLSNKICVLVTHQLQYLRNADKIIIMKDGKMEMTGSYTELKKSGLDFAKVMEEFNEVAEEDKRMKSIKSKASIYDEPIEDEEDQVLEKEMQEKGTIKAATYYLYLKAGGGICSMLALGFLFIICQVVANAGEYYVTYWVNLEQDFSEKQSMNLTYPNETINRDLIMWSYTALIVGNIIISIVKALYFMVFFVIASKNLHKYIFDKLIKATMRFYNTNPSGRILNRFSKDLGTVDEYLPSVIIDVIEIALLLLGAITLSAIVEPLLTVPAVVLMIIFYLLKIVYSETSRNVKRVEAITKSPMLTHLTASVNGLSTVRAFHAEKMLTEEFDNYQDNHSAAWFLYLASSKCFGLWLDIICIVFIAVAVFSLLLFRDTIHGGDLGLVITQYLGLMGSLQWGMRQWTELENNMTSVERILEYTRLETEPERKEPKNIPQPWPEKGLVEFKDVSLRYSPEDPPVLKGLNFTVQPKEKIGIVGRTGAGKSSTITALFQLYPLEGTVVIDGVDTTQIPLDLVRTNISIIPQEPVLFSGKMRENLDPFENYSDDVLWNALDQVELKDVISELPAGLNTEVTEGGNNFSVGQRQLVCLARALIRNNKILVMDEATANVDPHTDSLIQKTIRDKFADCTVLTIAHRLHTVMDSDKILVMNSGRVEEFNHPYLLLQNVHGVLHNLVDATGPSTAKNLENIAKESYEKKRV
ncbi:probable multidrug resistance-associated protein lethal(2)03659 [Diabrotica undecimpunctata]|uniref:probable multidrug resistance-associated protein lethal(2)03659 n=1 Tax=Diabrotica undecimpunctata TaxID=50387 RepID=UPI003B6429C5